VPRPLYGPTAPALATLPLGAAAVTPAARTVGSVVGGITGCGGGGLGAAVVGGVVAGGAGGAGWGTVDGGAAGAAVVGGVIGLAATGAGPAALAVESGSASGPAVTMRRSAAPPRPRIRRRRARRRRPFSLNAPRPSTAYEFPMRPSESCLCSRRSPSDPQPRGLSRFLRTGVLFLQLLVLSGEAPSGVVTARFGTTLGAGLRRGVN